MLTRLFLDCAIYTLVRLRLCGGAWTDYDGRCSLAGLVGAVGLRPAFSVEVIAPASEKQVARARPQPGRLVTETAALYAAVVEPHVSGMDPKAAHDLVVACGRTLDPTPCNVTFINNPGREGINENTPGERERIRGRRERAGPDGAHTRFMKRALRLADVFIRRAPRAAPL